jgi:hypothetical protein
MAPVVVAMAPPSPAPMAPDAPMAQAPQATATAGPFAPAPASAPAGETVPGESRIALARPSGRLMTMASAGADTRPPALQHAADAGDGTLIATLLAAGAAVDAPDAQGRTALLHAVLARQAAAVRALLAAGADPLRADRAGLTPRAAALRGQDADIAALFAPP